MKFFFSSLLIFFFLSSHGQVNTYQADLTSLRNILQKTPSYKDQIKGTSLAAYNELFERLKNDSVSEISSYRYFYNLAQLFFPIKDNHLSFYQVGKLPPDSLYPEFDGDIDSLRSILATSALDSIEGIYFYGDKYTVGLFKSKPGEYIGVVLDSKTPIWKKGQIPIHLYEYAPHYFKAVYGHPKFKILMLYSIEKYANRSLVNSYFYSSISESIYSKVVPDTDYVNLPRGIYNFHFKTLKPDIQYLHIKEFSADKTSMQRSDAFFDSIKNSLTASNLILDLRNNQGGAAKVSKKYLKLMKNYTKHGHLYVLVNNETISQGEIFTLQLMRLPNVKVLGQTTKGMLVYGSNYGKRERLSSKLFEVYITDMKGDKRLIPYENYGINPDISLTGNKDWIGQVVEIIKDK